MLIPKNALVKQSISYVTSGLRLSGAFLQENWRADKPLAVENLVFTFPGCLADFDSNFSHQALMMMGGTPAFWSYAKKHRRLSAELTATVLITPYMIVRYCTEISKKRLFEKENLLKQNEEFWALYCKYFSINE